VIFDPVTYVIFDGMGSGDFARSYSSRRKLKAQAVSVHKILLGALSQPVTMNFGRCTSIKTGRSRRVEIVAKKNQTMKSKINTWRIPTVKALPGRPGLTLPAAPKKRGKSPEEWEAARAGYRMAIRAHFASIAAFERKRRVALGLTKYQWLAVDVHGCCDVAKKNGGKVFSYLEPPPEGHVGEGQCLSPDWCRCVAKPVVPGFS
jgi:hypothetical protein